MPQRGLTAATKGEPLLLEKIYATCGEVGERDSICTHTCPGKFAGVISGADTAISESVVTATTQTATVQILSATRSSDTLTADVLVTNLAGHSFPSGVGFRRAFVNFQVLDSAGRELWASGETSRDGVILGANRRPLATEFFSPRQQTFQTHYWTGNPIRNQDQVQIYEELVVDPQGQLSTSFLSLDHKVKDNRLQPQGWSTAGFEAMETGPVGEAANDPDYTTMDSPGSNTMRYDMPLRGKVRRAAVVRATLYYQTIPPYYLRQRSEDARGVDTQRLRFFVRNLRHRLERARTTATRSSVSVASLSGRGLSRGRLTQSWLRLSTERGLG